MMRMMMSEKPRLTEPGVTYFINETLKHCHYFKEQHKNMIFNTIVLIFFLFTVMCILIYKYRGKLTPEEIRQKENIKKQYILSKIRNFQESKRRAQQELITGLPHWENELS